jgi:hypothetical protein
MQHPNASVSLATGSGLGTLVAWLVSNVFHLDLSAEAAAAIAGGISATVLFIGRRGIKGTLSGIWSGSPAPTDTAPTTYRPPRK